jgi:predicted PurR-regulated permease PerM
MAAHLKRRAPAAAQKRSEPCPTTETDPRKPLPLHAGARLTARVSLAITLVAAALWTAADFLPALAWAAILAISVWPLYVQFARTEQPSAAAALVFTVLVGCTIILPIALATYHVAQQSDTLFTWIKQAQENGIAVPEWVARLPIAADTLRQWWGENLADPQSASRWLQSINAEKGAEFLRAFGGQLLHRSFMFLFSLLALFVLLRNGRWIAQRSLQTADRIFGNAGEGLAGKMTEAIRGTVNGTVVVAVAEGLLIGLGYVVAGVPNPLLFTVLTAAFAMLPFGAWAAFTAAALTLGIAGGEPWMAVAVFAWGALVMLAGDNFVWPTLVGGAARLPFLFAFVGIFGGLATFGLLGLFLGPVIMAGLLTVWREWVMPREPQRGTP